MASPRPSPGSAVRWRIFAIIALASFVSYVLRANLSIAAPSMIEDLQLSEVQWGYVLAAFTAGYALFQFPGGIAGDRFGSRVSLTVIAVAWALLTVATALVPDSSTVSVGVSLFLLMSVRFLVGMFHAPIFPVLNTVIVRWFPPAARGLPQGLGSTALTLGYAAAAPLLAWLTIEFGWRVSFWFVAPAGLAVAALWWWYGRDEPAEHPAMTPSELAYIESGEEAPEIDTADIPPPPGWLRVLRNRDVLLLMAAYSCMNFMFYEVFNWFHLYLVDQRGFEPQVAGWVTSSQWIAGALGALLGGWLCDRLSVRLGIRWGCRWPVIGGLLVAAGLLVGGATSTDPVIAATLLALCFFFNQMTEAAFWVASMSIGGVMAGSAGGVMNTGANAMGIANAMLIPLFAQWLGWTFAIGSGALFALAGVAFMLFVRADRPVDLT